ncbi:hypothetical protein CFP56_011590 [Quercus suber]|uniref:Uncharacterized protein n=1 Tax=Quercus suber TaxID=58331 RepID=A0AAW0KY92_QUESU
MGCQNTLQVLKGSRLNKCRSQNWFPCGGSWRWDPFQWSWWNPIQMSYKLVAGCFCGGWVVVVVAMVVL